MGAQMSLTAEEQSGEVKIGAAHHTGRNIGVVVGALALGGAIFGFYRYSAQNDAAEIGRLEAFRAAYAQKCDSPDWAAGELSPILRDSYLNSSDLRVTTDKQLQALNAGASCDDVLKALKSASFPLPAK